MIIPNEDLRRLCIKKDWFTEGTNEQYAKLFHANKLGASVETLATIIWLCSDSTQLQNLPHAIKDTLTKAADEYDRLVDLAD